MKAPPLAELRTATLDAASPGTSRRLSLHSERSVLYLRTLATTAWRVLGQFIRGLVGGGT